MRMLLRVVGVLMVLGLFVGAYSAWGLSGAAALPAGPVTSVAAARILLEPIADGPNAAQLRLRRVRAPWPRRAPVPVGTPAPTRRALLAASAVGPHGRVVASDISAAMLAAAASKPVDSAWAPIEYLECSATAIDALESSFDAVLCRDSPAPCLP